MRTRKSMRPFSSALSRLANTPASLGLAVSLIASSVVFPTIQSDANANGPAQGTEQKKPNKESDFYPIVSFEIPEGVELEATSFQRMPDGKMAVASRRGEIWMIENPTDKQVSSKQFKRFAHGLHEPIGMDFRDGWLYVTQRPDISRLRDTDGDGEADEFEVVADGWQITGDYHEYAFGSKFDKEGNIWVVLCLTGSFGSDALYREIGRAHV